MRRLIKLAFFFHAFFQSVSDLMQPNRPVYSPLRELPRVSSLANPKQNQYELYVLQLYNELPQQIQIDSDRLYVQNQLSHYIFLAAFLNKTAAINLIDRALEMGEDINVGRERGLPNLLELLSSHISNKDYHQLADNDRHDLMRYLLEKGAEASRTLGSLIYIATLLRGSEKLTHDYTSQEKIFNSMQIILSHDADLLNRPIPFVHPTLSAPPALPLATAIDNRAAYLVRFLLNQPNIQLDIKVGDRGFIGKFVQEWQTVKDKLFILESLLKGGAPVYDRRPGSPVFEPMEIAIHTGQTEVIEVLAGYGAAVNYHDSRDRYRASPLLHTLFCSQKLEKKIEMMQVLLNLHAQINELSPLIENGTLSDKEEITTLPAEPVYTALYAIIAKPIMDEAKCLRLMDFLLENNADPNLRSNDYAFPLHLALFRGSDSLIERLIEGGADPELRDNKDQSAFDIADLKDLQLTKPKYRKLLQKSSSPAAIIPAPVAVLVINILAFASWRHKLALSCMAFIPAFLFGTNPLFSRTKSWLIHHPTFFLLAGIVWTAGFIKDLYFMYNYFSKQKNPPRNQQPKTITRPKQRRRSFSQRLEKKDPSPNSVKRISLVEACRTDNLPELKKYLEEKTDLDQIEKDLSPLQAACLYGNFQIVELLCDEKGFAANRENAQGETALFMAAKKNHWEVVNLLLDHKEKLQLAVKAVNTYSDQLLKLAVENLSMPYLKKMLAIYPEHHKGEFLLNYLTQSKKNSIAEKTLNEFVSVYINAHREEINSFSTSKRFTLLMAACQWGYLHVVECLMAANVNIHLLDVSGKSALYYAAEQALIPENKPRYKAWTHIIQLLLKQGAQLNFRYENSDPPPASDVKIENFVSQVQWETIKKSELKIQLETQIQKMRPLASSWQAPAKQSGSHLSVPEQAEIKVKKSVPVKKKKVLDSKIKMPPKPAPFEKKETVNHQSWANVIVDYIVRLGVIYYQELGKSEQELSSEQQAFQIYMQHCLRVYYLHRLLFALTCYGKHIQRDYKLIDGGQTRDMMTKRGQKSLCQFLSYEVYDAVLSTTTEIVKILPDYLLNSLKKPHEHRKALRPRQRLEVANLFGLIEKTEKKSDELRPVGQLFIQDTKLYSILSQFHHSLTQNNGVIGEHFASVKDFWLPAMRYVYSFLARMPDAKRETQNVLLKGTLDYTGIENHYRNYLDLLVLLFSLCGETLLAPEHPSKMRNFVYRCRDAVRNKVAHDAKITFGAEFLLQLAQDACPLVRKEINWERVVEMPDRAILMREEMKAGLEKIGYYRFFESLPSQYSPIDIIINYASLRIY